MRQDCIGIFGWLFGHKFEGRYNVYKEKHPMTMNPPLGAFIDIKGPVPPNIDKRMYQGDVCLRCGQIVNKPIIPNP